MLFRTGFETGSDVLQALTTTGTAFLFSNGSTSLMALSRGGALNLSITPTTSAGTYDFCVTAPASNVNSHVLRLYNITDGAIVPNCEGQPGYSGASNVQLAQLRGRFTLAAQKVLEIQHRSSSTQATSGFGLAANMGQDEIYTVAEFWKIT